MNAIDTNILIYAIDVNEVIKGPIALSLIETIDQSKTLLPWQVVCDFGAAITKLRQRGRTTLEPIEAVTSIRQRFEIALPDASVLDRALVIQQEAQISYWDALLYAACECARVKTLYTEDVPANTTQLNFSIVNPF